MAAAGAAALVGQTVLVRELMVSFYGTELALAAVLSCWLLFIPAGALLGTAALKLARRDGLLVDVALVGMGVGLVAEFLLARLVRPLLGAEAGAFLSLGSMLLGAGAAALPVAFWVGFLFPAAAHAEESGVVGHAAGISRVYVAEAIGSGVAGGLLSLYLLSRLGPDAVVFSTAFILLLCGAWHAAGRREWPWGAVGAVVLVCMGAAWRRPALFLALAAGAATCWWAYLALRRSAQRRMVASVAFLAMGLAVAVAHVGWGEWLSLGTARLRWATFSRFRLLAGRDSRYQRMELGELEGSYVLVQDGFRTAQFPEPAGARGRAALLLTQHPGPADVLVIGGGLGGLCQSMLGAPIRRLDYVEPDPRLVSFVYEHLPPDLKAPLADERFAAYRCDGRYFVRTSGRDRAALARTWLPLAGDGPADGRLPAEAYDLVVVNVGDPVSASGSRFYTLEFCREVGGILREGGTAAFCGITGAENYLGGGPALRYAACIYNTLGSAFGGVVVRPGDELCFFAGREATADAGVLEQRFDALGLEPEELKYAFSLSEFPAERVRWMADLLERERPRALLNTDERPVLFTLFLALQKHYARGAGRPGRGGDVFQAVRSLSAAWFWLPLAAVPALAGVIRLGWRRRRAIPWACGLGVFSTGVFGLSAEMLIVYRYQTSFGFVYRDISIIVGLFMLGLALGGWLTGRVLRRRAAPALLLGEALQGGLVFVLPACLGLLSFSPAAFVLLSPVAGFLTGVEFPLAARVSLAQGRAAGTTAGLLDAADHLGALAGAVCTGLLLVPALGIGRASSLVALLKCASLAALALALLPEREA